MSYGYLVLGGSKRHSHIIITCSVVLCGGGGDGEGEGEEVASCPIGLMSGHNNYGTISYYCLMAGLNGQVACSGMQHYSYTCCE